MEQGEVGNRVLGWLLVGAAVALLAMTVRQAHASTLHATSGGFVDIRRDLMVAEIGGTSADGTVGVKAGASTDAGASGDEPFEAMLKRRCPEILGNPAFYDEDIVGLCLRARSKR
jgi:hypothetical protein